MQSNPLSKHKSCISVSELSCSSAFEKHFFFLLPLFYILDAVVIFSWLSFYHIIPKFVSLYYAPLCLFCCIKCCQLFCLLSIVYRKTCGFLQAISYI